MISICAALTTWVVMSGCGNAIDCALNGDTIQGRVTFGSNVAIRSDANIVVQHSLTSFAVDSESTVKSNPQGLLTVPYSVCTAASTFQLRAFEDLNRNETLDAGEPYGLLDGTSNGDGSYVSQTVSTNADGTTARVTDADIVIDNP